MPKQILVYRDIYSYTAAEFIEKLNEANGADIEVRINTNGGEPEYAWGMIANFSDYEGNKSVKVDGKAHSMGLFFLCYTEDSECLDVSQGVLHRAAYPEWVESNDKIFTAAMKANLANVNASLRKALEAKIDVEKFQKLKGVTLDQIFSMDTRLDVALTASDMKKIGLVKKIVTITPQKKAEIEALVKESEQGARFTGVNVPHIDPVKEVEAERRKLGTLADHLPIAAETETVPAKESKIFPMTIEKLKAEHPAVYNEIMKLGVKQERDRVSAWMAFQKIDAEAVTKGISDGSEVNSKVLAEMTAKALSAEGLKKLQAEAAPVVTTAEAEAKAKTEKEKNLEAFEQKVKAELKTL